MDVPCDRVSSPMTDPVDYDIVAPAYDHRYEANSLDDVAAALQLFLGTKCADAAEVGCGTGHWLAEMKSHVRWTVGLDLSAEMLKRARTAVPRAPVVRGRAEQLPWLSGSLDRVVCINALHHFRSSRGFMREAHRVLRPGGGVLMVGLDPHTRLDSWWVYEYFPAALQRDRERYLPAAVIRKQLQAAGFVRAATEVAQHISSVVPFAEATALGRIDRRFTSQLLVISDAEYEDGLARLRAEQPVLHSDLRLFATVAWTDSGHQR